jgi:adenosylcobinamide-phosphate synthase
MSAASARHAPEVAGAAILVAVALDLVGELPARWHPVVWYGTAIGRLERYAPHGEGARLAYGGGMIVLAAPLALLPAMAVQRLARRVQTTLAGRGHARCGIVAAAVLEGAALTPFFALRMLVASGRTVRVALERDDLPAAREALASLVSRERAGLDASLVAAAAVESLAENLSDSVVAPLLCYALFGLPGAAFYRLVNTFDAMIGYHGQYEHLGKAAARLDDALNFLPARLTAALIVALAPLFGGDARAAWRVWRRDAARTASPNAGHPIAAAAGALGVQLEKVGHYTLGDARQPVTPATIRLAETMVHYVSGVAVLVLAGTATRRGTRLVAHG